VQKTPVGVVTLSDFGNRKLELKITWKIKWTIEGNRRRNERRNTQTRILCGFYNWSAKNRKNVYMKYVYCIQCSESIIYIFFMNDVWQQITDYVNAEVNAERGGARLFWLLSQFIICLNFLSGHDLFFYLFCWILKCTWLYVIIFFPSTIYTIIKWLN